jgi:copper ion binding protein
MSIIETTYTVTGMTCDHCARAVTAEVGAIEGVTEVDVDVATGSVRVSAAAPVSSSRLREAVEEAGYQLAP